jgi:hypothetical protein
MMVQHRSILEAIPTNVRAQHKRYNVHVQCKYLLVNYFGFLIVNRLASFVWSIWNRKSSPTWLASCNGSCDWTNTTSVCPTWRRTATGWQLVPARKGCQWHVGFRVRCQVSITGCHTSPIDCNQILVPQASTAAVKLIK